MGVDAEVIDLLPLDRAWPGLGHRSAQRAPATNNVLMLEQGPLTTSYGRWSPTNCSGAFFDHLDQPVKRLPERASPSVSKVLERRLCRIEEIRAGYAQMLADSGPGRCRR